jgi:F1F0 ATPase subunit 2
VQHWLQLVLLFAAGAVLAALYLGALWWTVQRVARADQPALWLLASLLMRLLLLGAAFYLIIVDGHWQGLLAALAGFVVLRTFVLRQVRIDPTAAQEESI